MISAWFFAFTYPLVWAFMNILDKYVVTRKVKQPLSFAVLAGIVNILFGILLGIFLDWSNIGIKDMIFPAIAGIFLGLQFYIYFLILQKEDAAPMVSFVFVYPILIALLSYIFLGEVISVIGYFGMFLILIGVVALSFRIKKIKLEIGVWMIILMIILVAAYEFFIKVATINIPEFNGMAISGVALGLTILPALLYKKTREGFAYTLRNIKWAFINESFTYLAVILTYFAMAKLPATIVSSVGAIQPLAVLFFENIADRILGGKLTKDKEILPKLIPIILIVLGVVLIYAFS